MLNGRLCTDHHVLQNKHYRMEAGERAGRRLPARAPPAPEPPRPRVRSPEEPHGVASGKLCGQRPGLFSCQRNQARCDSGPAPSRGNLTPGGLWWPRESDVQLSLEAPRWGRRLPGSRKSSRRSLVSIWPPGTTPAAGAGGRGRARNRLGCGEALLAARSNPEATRWTKQKRERLVAENKPGCLPPLCPSRAVKRGTAPFKGPWRGRGVRVGQTRRGAQVASEDRCRLQDGRDLQPRLRGRMPDASCLWTT